VYDGATRSGKTRGAVPGFVNWALAYPKSASYLVASKTWLQIRETLVPELQRYAEELGFPTPETYNLRRNLNIGHVRFVFAEGGKYDSATKIKSLTTRGCLLDEATEMSEDFVQMAESRCLSYEGWKSVMTCNPEGPGHWFKRTYIDPALDGDPEYERIPFRLIDNPTVRPDEVERLFRNNSSLWRRRMLHGEWVAATGAIYPSWDAGEPPAGEPELRWASLDYAASGVAHALVFEQYGEQVYVADEWRYDGRTEGPLRMERKASRIAGWLDGRPIALMLVDPATPNDMKSELADRLGVYVVNAPNEVREGINATAAWLERPYLQVAPRCTATQREFGVYVWDEAAAERGEDKPIKRDDHAMDALRYGVAGYPLIRRYGTFRAQPIEHAMDDA